MSAADACRQRRCRPSRPPTSTPSSASSDGRPRGVAEVAHRCPCGEPDVLRTEPRLPDGTPFPTTYYATCPRLTGAVSTLETAGVMKEMTERLADDEEPRRRLRAGPRALPRAARRARRRARDRRHLRRRHADPRQVPARPRRATRWRPGPGVNPLGDEALAMLDDWWHADVVRGRARGRGRRGRQVAPTPEAPTVSDPGRHRATRRPRRRDRLRHQLDPPARRRRRPRRPVARRRPAPHGDRPPRPRRRPHRRHRPRVDGAHARRHPGVCRRVP